ncbi:GNAT family N-acetyltransferase [Nautilia sp. PV-1]|uniref:GNAT family N-acetyltransferase n=1 Tax=Nautilia sp. PV-1 TaxID=2579250 RepID=UPI001AEFFF18|nr:GNAT family N-acetyltransferase [Nautilia sp. PV-1]
MKIIFDVYDYIDDLMALYKNEWWSDKRSKDDVIKMLQNTTFVFGIVKDDKLIAFCRVLSDLVYKALIFDVIVDKNYRGEGVSKILLNEVFNHPKLRNVAGFELYCLEEMKDYYEKLGFKKLDLILMKR